VSSVTFGNVFLTALVFACSACARFENPVVAEEGPRFDERLAGHWYTESDEGKFDMEIRRDGDEGIVVATGTKVGEEPESDQMRIITARVGQHTFASVAGFKEGSHWTLFRYDVATPDVLIIYQDDDHAWNDALRNKVLPGSTDETGRNMNSTVTASSEQLRDFLLGYGSVVFNEQPSAEFRRVPTD